MLKNKASDEYCDASVDSSVQGMKQMGVKLEDIIAALSRAKLRLQHDEWIKSLDNTKTSGCFAVRILKPVEGE